MSRKIKVVVERHLDGYVAYPLGLREGVAIVGEGDTYEDAIADLTSAVRLTLETKTESEIFDDEFPLLDARIAEAEVLVGVQVPG
jgi:predicted RNase H-like HicB family nuclease